jgi:hypothetical protein
MASLEPALNRQSRGPLTAFKAALGVTLSRLGTATARRSKHARLVALRVREALDETCQVATGLAAVAASATAAAATALGGAAGSSHEKAKAKVTRRVKQLKSRLWHVLHASRHAVTRGTWEACLARVASRLEAALVAHYVHHACLAAHAAAAAAAAAASAAAAGTTGGGRGAGGMDEAGSAKAEVASTPVLTPAASAAAAAPATEVDPPGPQEVPKGLLRRNPNGGPPRLTVPLLVRRRLRPGDAVKVLWCDDSDENGADEAGDPAQGDGASQSAAEAARSAHKRPAAESESDDAAAVAARALPPLNDPSWCVWATPAAQHAQEEGEGMRGHRRRYCGGVGFLARGL